MQFALDIQPTSLSISHCRIVEVSCFFEISNIFSNLLWCISATVGSAVLLVMLSGCRYSWCIVFQIFSFLR